MGKAFTAGVITAKAYADRGVVGVRYARTIGVLTQSGVGSANAGAQLASAGTRLADARRAVRKVIEPLTAIFVAHRAGIARS